MSSVSLILFSPCLNPCSKFFHSVMIFFSFRISLILCYFYLSWYFHFWYIISLNSFSSLSMYSLIYLNIFNTLKYLSSKFNACIPLGITSRELFCSFWSLFLCMSFNTILKIVHVKNGHFSQSLQTYIFLSSFELWDQHRVKA